MIELNSPKKVTPNREVESDNIYFLMLGIEFLVLGIEFLVRSIYFLMLGIYFLMLSIEFLMLSIYFLILSKRAYSATQTTTRFSSFELKG